MMKFAISCAAAAGLALLLCRVDGARLPQVAKGGDALSIAFSDAKETIGAAMVQKANSYFHGGIDVDCHEKGHHHHHHSSQCPHDVCEPPDHQHGFDPWRWINSHVRAPERHIHLDDGRAVELMPWFWASVKADPHNIDAWTTAWYVANDTIKDKELALRVVAEGLEKNPDDPDLLVCRGRTLYDNGRGETAAAREAFLAAVAAAGRMLQRGGSSDERILKARDFAQAFLDKMAQEGTGARKAGEAVE